MECGSKVQGSPFRVIPKQVPKFWAQCSRRAVNSMAGGKVIPNHPNYRTFEP
jgi:hypothetical protein